MRVHRKLHPLEKYIVTVVIGAAVAWSLFLAVDRLDGENRSRRVELAFPESRLLALTALDPAAPQRLQAAGVTTLIREPYTLESMLRFSLAEFRQPQPDHMEIRLEDERLASNAAVYLTGQYGIESLQIQLRETPAPHYIMDIKLPQALPRIDPSRVILEISQGPMPPGFRRGLMLPAGDWGRTADLDQFTQAIASLRPDLVIPDWRGGINPTWFFRAYFNTPWLHKPVMMVPEFHLPKAGQTTIRRQQGPRGILRAHVPRAGEIQGLSAEQLRLRLLRAARERGVGLLYLDPPADWNFLKILNFYQALHADLQHAGFQIGPVNGARLRRTGYWAMNVIYWGVAGLMLLFIWKAALWAVGFTGKEEAVDRVVTIRLKPSQFRWAAFYTGMILMILHWQGNAAWSGKLAAWLIAVLVPLLVFSELVERPEPELGWRKMLLTATRDFLQICLWSGAAGAGIAILLYQPDFVQRLNSFWGVKLAYVLPLGLLILYFFPTLLESDFWRERWQSENRPILLAGGVLVLGLGALLLARSGNNPWLPVSGVELSLRDHLETWLGVRPRFKEFLFGHPLLLLGLAARRFPKLAGKLWPEVCILAGMLGQLSMINSFCHVHTPLAISVGRSLHGMWLGYTLGLILVLVSWRWAKHRA